MAEGLTSTPVDAWMGGALTVSNPPVWRCSVRLCTEGFTADEMALLAAVAARTTTEIRVQFAAVSFRTVPSCCS